MGVDVGLNDESHALAGTSASALCPFVHLRQEEECVSRFDLRLGFSMENRALGAWPAGADQCRVSCICTGLRVESKVAC